MSPSVSILVREDLVVKVLLAVIVTCFTLLSLPDRAASGRPADLFMAFFILNAWTRAKFPPHWLNLPVAGRDLLLARLWSLFLVGAALMFTGWLALLLFWPSLLQAGTVSLLHGVLGSALPVLTILCIRPKQATQWPGLSILLVIGGLTAMSFIRSEYFVPPAAGACLLLTYYALKNAPESYLVASSRPMAVDPWWTAPRRLFATRWAGMPVVRSLASGDFLFMPLLMTDLGGWLSAFYGLAAVSSMLQKRLAWTFLLPFSRRRILMLSLSLGVVAFAGGVWIHLRPQRSEVAAARSRFRREGADRPTTATPSVVVSNRYLRWAWNGAVPLVQAPWGERVQGDPSVPVGPLRLYNPYFAGPQNSQRFFEWQFARATRDIYGQAFRSTDNLTGVRPLRLAPQRVITTAGLSLSIGLLSLALLFWIRRRPIDGEQILAWCFYLLPAFLAVMVVILHACGAGLPVLFSDSYSVEVLAGALAPWLPAQTAMLTALWFAILTVLYLTTEASFARLNAPTAKRR